MQSNVGEREGLQVTGKLGKAGRLQRRVGPGRAQRGQDGHQCFRLRSKASRGGEGQVTGRLGKAWRLQRRVGPGRTQRGQDGSRDDVRGSVQNNPMPIRPRTNRLPTTHTSHRRYTQGQRPHMDLVPHDIERWLARAKRASDYFLETLRRATHWTRPRRRL